MSTQHKNFNIFITTLINVGTYHGQPSFYIYGREVDETVPIGRDGRSCHTDYFQIPIGTPPKKSSTGMHPF